MINYYVSSTFVSDFVIPIDLVLALLKNVLYLVSPFIIYFIILC